MSKHSRARFCELGIPRIHPWGDVKTNIELKNVKITEKLSEETPCFTATMYVDGQRFCEASNRGFGGPNDYKPLPKTPAGTQNVVAAKIREINEELKDYRIPTGWGNGYITPDIDCVVNSKVSEHARDKEIKKTLKKVAYYKPEDGEIYVLPSKHKPTPETLKAVKETKWWKPENKMLNEMSMDDIRELPTFKVGDTLNTMVRKEDVEDTQPEEEQSSGPGM